MKKTKHFASKLGLKVITADSADGAKQRSVFLSDRSQALEH